MNLPSKQNLHTLQNIFHIPMPKIKALSANLMHPRGYSIHHCRILFPEILWSYE